MTETFSLVQLTKALGLSEVYPQVGYEVMATRCPCTQIWGTECSVLEGCNGASARPEVD